MKKPNPTRDLCLVIALIVFFLSMPHDAGAKKKDILKYKTRKHLIRAAVPLAALLSGMGKFFKIFPDVSPSNFSVYVHRHNYLCSKTVLLLMYVLHSTHLSL